MAKRKYPSELNTRTVRVNIGDWQWLNSLSQRLGTTVAEAFHKVVTGLDHKTEPKVEPAQIPMTDFQVTAPVTLRFRSQPTIAQRSQPTIAVNGNKAGVVVVKPKGGVISD